MEQEKSKHGCAKEQRRKQRDTTSEQSKAKEKECDRYSHDTLLTFWNSSDDRFAIFTAISGPQHLANTHTLHMVTTDIYLHILLREAYSALAYS